MPLRPRPTTKTRARLPIVGHFEPRPTPAESALIEEVAEVIRRDRPDLLPAERWAALMIAKWQDGPALHVDDLGAIRLPQGKMKIDYLQDRARLRAAEGDFIAASMPPPAGFAEYFRDRLGLGGPTWLTPQSDSPSLATACWQDRTVRRRLVSAIRGDRLAYLHPHMGNAPIWELAAQLTEASRRPVRVIGPPPGVCEWANDKLAFADTVKRLLGPSFVPKTRKAANLTMLARLASELCEDTRRLAIKTPESAGGMGNYVLESDRVRGRSLIAVRRILKRLLRNVVWERTSEVLIGSWETNVLGAPSAQLWLPPPADGPPVVEGLFMQSIEGERGTFSGTEPADLGQSLANDMAHWSWMLGALFQRLGYVGRCSFDMLLVGRSLTNCRVKFIECNGRWGGTSLPMTLMNRLFGDWTTQPFRTREHFHEGLTCLRFAEVLEQFGDKLYDARTGRGELILFTPTRMEHSGTLSVLALGERAGEAQDRVAAILASRLGPLVESASA